MQGVFKLSAADLDQLSSEEAVEALRRLLWAEAHAMGLGTANLNVPSEVTTGDGGIDAELVGPAQHTGREGILEAGWNAYQVKTGPYNVHREAKVRELLFDEVKPAKGGKKTWRLKPRVKECFDRGGVFHIVLFGEDPPHPKGDPLNLFRKVLGEQAPGLGEVRLRLWQANQLASLIERYPALVADVARRPPSPGLPRTGWATWQTMRVAFHADEALAKSIVAAQDGIRQADQARHFRILGEAGIGKTRLALEITGAPDLEPLTLYFASPRDFRASPVVAQLCSPGSPLQAVLVVDECPAADAATLWDQVGGLGPRVHLITIYNKITTSSGTTVRVDPPHLRHEQIEAIFRDYLRPEEDVRRWIPFCSGSPRVAHVLARNLKNNPQDLLATPDDVDVWNRFVAGDDPLGSDQVRHRLLVLRHLALFERFGFEEDYRAEAQAIHALVQEVDSAVTWPQFALIVGELRERKLLQGDVTLYITPRALHIRLWADWWNLFRREFDYVRFKERLPAPLLAWFHDMLRYADASALAREVVSGLLAPGSPVDWKSLLPRDEGRDFFLALAEADPAGGLEVLEGLITPLSKEELKGLLAPRRTFVRALEMMSVWQDLFPSAARLLLKLGAAENESWVNNASGTFTGLFSLGDGPLAPTEAAPPERFELLEEVLTSGDQDERQLGLLGLQAALSAHSGRIVGFEYQGVRPAPKLWHPETYGEWFDAFRWAWVRTVRVFREEQGALQRAALKVLLDTGPQLLRMANLSEMVLATFEELAHDLSGADRIALFQTVQDLLCWQGPEDPQVHARIQALHEQLVGKDYTSRLRRWVELSRHEDFEQDEEGEQHLTRELRLLAREGGEAPERLRAELSWLSASTEANAYHFGFQLGLWDVQQQWLDDLLASFQQPGQHSTLLLAGYLRAVFHRDATRAEAVLDGWAALPETRGLVLELTFRTQLSQRGAQRLLGLIEEGHLPAESLAAFRYSPEVQHLPPALFKQWLRTLASVPTQTAVTAALTMLHVYYNRREPPRPLPVKMTTDLLIRSLDLFTAKKDTMSDYDWAEVAKRLGAVSPAATMRLARHLLTRVPRTIWQTLSQSRVKEVLTRAARERPRELWPLVARHLTGRSPISFYVQQWLQGELRFLGSPRRPGALTLFDQGDLWAWVDADVHRRAWKMASIVPATFGEDGGTPNLVRELLIRYGDREDVRNNLAANFGTEGWTGPASEHLGKKAQSLKEVMRQERHPSVKRWLAWYIRYVEQGAKRERVQEERGRLRNY